MNKKSSKKMRGFMCQSPAATALCMTSDPRSVIVPRRPQRTLVDHSPRLLNAKYSRLAESHGLSPAAKRPVFVPSIKRDAQPHQECLRSLQKLSSSMTSSDQVFQVVVMKVSLHCQGCAGKVKKHLSKMEGVTSFSIDLETKRVTVMGHVSPAGVLESVSKVKRAEFWPCST